MIKIYVGGACKVSQGPAGWAALLVDAWGNASPFSGSEPESTAKRMELKAVIEGLLRLAPGSQAAIHSMHSYLAGGRDAASSELDRDLWAILDRLLARRSVSWEQIDHQADDPHPGEALRLARRACGLQEEYEDLTDRGGMDMAESARGEPEWDKPTGPSDPTVIEDLIGRELTHLDAQGSARMVDISHKAASERVAIARGRVAMEASTMEMIRSGTAAKGDVLTVARIAGVMAAKQTPALIPLCHPLILDDVSVDLELNEAENVVEITATVKTTGKTGVEMEAMIAVSISALTIYDMCKAVDRRMRVDGVRLVRKVGGKSGDIVLE